jgi:hypothetical protein
MVSRIEWVGSQGFVSRDYRTAVALTEAAGAT